jgi:hypothetical protein
MGRREARRDAARVDSVAEEAGEARREARKDADASRTAAGARGLRETGEKPVKTQPASKAWPRRLVKRAVAFTGAITIPPRPGVLKKLML